MQIVNDTLRPKGKYEMKRIAAFISFHFAVIYAFIPMFWIAFEVKEFVFWGFLAYSGTAIGLNVYNKKIDKDAV